jgi:predicted dehydrogenase
LINDPAINTIAILTRHHLHARLVLAGLHAGKHVFCEKPLALTQAQLEEIENFFATIKSTPDQNAPGSDHAHPDEDQPLLTVGFNRRFAPLARRLFDFYQGRQEPLVAHYRVNAGYLPLNHWLHDPAQGGGRILGEGCHFIDFLTFLVGASPQEVTARGLPDGGQYNEDNVTLVFTFPDHSIGTLTYLANGDKAFPKERLEVFAAGRVAVLDDYRSLELVNDGRSQVFHSRLRQDKGHLGEWEAFTQAILYKKQPPIPYAQLFGVTRAALAAVEALHSGQTIRIGQPP